MMLLAEIVATSLQVRSTRSRKRKVAALADLLHRMEAKDAAIATAFLSGEPRQRAIGVGYAAVAAVEVPPAETPSLLIADVDRTLDEIAAESGPGSAGRRSQALTQLFATATSDEQAFLRGLILRNIRQGALEGIMVEALAEFSGTDPAGVRRAAMLSGSLVDVAEALLADGPDALQSYSLELFRPIQPMLAQSAGDVAEAMERAGNASVEAKLDGARIQVHRDGSEVAVYTRNLRDVTSSLPGIVHAVLELPVSTVILDGESLALHQDGRPLPFQESISEFSSETAEPGGAVLQPFFFDCLYLDGATLLDEPAAARWAALESVVPPEMLVARVATADVAEAETLMAETLARGHEGVVVKSLASPYEAGRRGATWIKVKPSHTLDLVVLGVEWGSGRRQGWLSNIHLGARDPDGGGFVMLGKTFKGMTDAMLEWQTERFLELETHREGHVVYVRPEQVVEIAIDGVQRSSRYPGGVALRFARVKRYRDDKSVDEADTIGTVRAIHRGGGG